MKNLEIKMAQRKAAIFGAATLLSTAAFFSAPAVSFADDPYSMAPPIDQSADQPVDQTFAEASSNPVASTVFNWQEVPANQEVPINRAVFDQGGYQLYDSVGETIVVPFKDNNLYVMKFAVSDNGKTYFVNSGTAPILYVPEGGYLENATVAGARWYPFTQSFHPATPVFCGIAPSWSDYVDIGWYPDMCCRGGYWSELSFGYFAPSFGLFISFGGHHFDGWGGYRDYAYAYPAPCRIGFYHENYYHYAERPYWGGRSFDGGFGGRFAGRGYAGGFYGHEYTAHAFQGGGGYHGYNGQFNGNVNHNFQGNGGSQGYNGQFNGNVNHNFQGGGGSHGYNGQFNGNVNHNFQGNSGSHGYNGQFNGNVNHNFQGGGGSHGYNGQFNGNVNHNFQGNGGSQGYNGPFNGNDNHAFQGGGGSHDYNSHYNGYTSHVFQGQDSQQYHGSYGSPSTRSFSGASRGFGGEQGVGSTGVRSNYESSGGFHGNQSNSGNYRGGGSSSSGGGDFHGGGSFQGNDRWGHH